MSTIQDQTRVTNHFTMSVGEFDTFGRIASRQKPEFRNWSVTSTMAGWTTVNVPNWNGTHSEFMQAVSR